MAKKARKSRKRPVPEADSYILEIMEWGPTYHFSTGDRFLTGDEYWEYGSLELGARGLFPKRIEGETIRFTILGDRRADAALKRSGELGFEPLCVGTLHVRGQRRDYLGSLPMTVIWGMIPALESGLFKFIDLHGERLRYGSAAIWSMRFAQDIDLEDYG